MDRYLGHEVATEMIERAAQASDEGQDLAMAIVDADAKTKTP